MVEVLVNACTYDGFIQSILDKCEEIDVSLVESTFDSLLDRSINDIISDSNSKGDSGGCGSLCDVASSHYREAISNKNDMSKIKQYLTEMNETCNLLEIVISKIGSNFEKCHDYALDGLARYKSINRLVCNSDLIIKIFSLPEEINSALGAGEYERAFQLIAVSERLEESFGNAAFVSKILYKVDGNRRQLHEALCGRLKSEGDLGNLAGFVSLLKGLGLTPESEIKRVFIEKRSDLIGEKISSVQDDISDLVLRVDAYHALLADDIYQFVSFYKSLFGSLDGEVSKVVINTVVQVLELINKSHKLSDKNKNKEASPPNVLSQLSGVSARYAAYGLDFTCVVYSIFTDN